MAAYDILLIEDDRDLCELMASYISGAGYSILTAENGLMAQELLRLERFRMIITDIRVPNRTGLQLAALARGSRAHAHVPIVLISGHVDLGIAIKAKELKIVDLLVKPFDNSELLAKIKSYLLAPEALKVNPVFASSFDLAAKGFFDELLGNNTLISHKQASKDWGKASEISAFMIFNNTEVTGELTFYSSKKVIHDIASTTFRCKDTTADDELLINITSKILERMGQIYMTQLLKHGAKLELSSPKVQLDYKDQDLVAQTQSLICIPFATGEKSCRLDFLVKRNQNAEIHQAS